MRFFHISLILIAVSLPAAPRTAQQKFRTEFGYLDARHDRARWLSPESLLRDLRSRNDDVRIRALHLLGATDGEAYESQSGLNGGEAIVVARPDQLQLQYAAIGDRQEQQAILAVRVGVFALVAVATPVDGAWDRIAVYRSSCQLESSRDLSQSVRIENTLGLFPVNQLILYASGGEVGPYGVDRYVQDEVHLGFYQGELHRTIAFEKRVKSCENLNITPHWCSIEERWFSAVTFKEGLGGALVTSSGKFNTPTELEFLLPQSRIVGQHAQNVTCDAYLWNRRTYRYEALTGSNICKSDDKRK